MLAQGNGYSVDNLYWSTTLKIEDGDLSYNGIILTLIYSGIYSTRRLSCVKESFSNMAVPIDLTSKCKMCDFTCLKRVQLCVKPAGFLVHNVPILAPNMLCNVLTRFKKVTVTKKVTHYKKLVPVTHKLVPETRNKNQCFAQSWSHRTLPLRLALALRMRVTDLHTDYSDRVIVMLSIMLENVSQEHSQMCQR